MIDEDATVFLTRRVPNNEAELLELLADVRELAEGEPVTWAVDLNAGGAALWIALLVKHDQRLLYIPGRTIHHASGAYRGSGKTDAKDAFVIADTARMRRDLQPLQAHSEIAVDLKILTARRMDLSADRTRAINRLRAQLLEYFPALERAFDYSTSKTALTTGRTCAGVVGCSGRTCEGCRRPSRCRGGRGEVRRCQPGGSDCRKRAQVAAIHCPESKRFYQRKRAEGKNHKQAVLALARRRLNVLWALIRDHRTFEATPAATAA